MILSYLGILFKNGKPEEVGHHKMSNHEKVNLVGQLEK
jgi:hypothetical protein